MSEPKRLTKLIMTTACVGALLLTSRRGRWWTDTAAIVLAAYAMFANELGLLVAVVLIAGYVVGFRNVSRAGVGVVCGLLLLYIYLRFFGLNAGLPELTSFVLPGGTRAAAALHLCRTVARRAERVLVELAASETLNPEALRYVNRLSDFFFVAARHANADGKSDVLWVPGQNR